jgi:hypothetical protein
MTYVVPDMTQATLNYYISNIIQNGDTLVLLEGELEITTEINITKTFSIIGQGYDKTTIYGHVGTAYASQCLHFTATIDIPMRLSKFTLKGIGDTTTDHSNGIAIEGECKQLRIDHCYFVDNGAHTIYLNTVKGLIDHNIFYNDSVESILIRNNTYQNQVWTDFPAIGTSDAVFIEDNDYQFLTVGTHAVTSLNGSRVVFRHNTITSQITGALIDQHGNYEELRGSYSWEIYDNEITCPTTAYIAYGIYLRSGLGVVYNNNFRVAYLNRLTYPIILTNYRSWTSNTSHPAVCTEVVDGTTYNCNVHTYEDARLYDSIREGYFWNNKLYNASAVGADAEPII